MHTTIKSLCSVVSLILLAASANAAGLSGQWPALDKPPPPVASWTALVDKTKVPNAPIQKTAGGSCPTADTFCNWSCTGCARQQDITFCPQKHDWGLSFDDGPTEFTPALLDVLEQKNTYVTFFVIGSRVAENPETLQRAIKNGHQIAVHTWSHTPLTTQTNEEIIAEIKYTEKAIKAAGGITPRYMRPPYGDIDDRVRGILTQLGYKVVIWDLDTNDWISGEDKTFNMKWVGGNFTQWVRNTTSPTGHISLEHDLYQQTAAQGPIVVPIVQNAGFTIKPVAECVNDPNPYLENVPLGAATPTTNTSTTSTGTASTAPPSYAQDVYTSSSTSASASSPTQNSSSSTVPSTAPSTLSSDATSDLNIFKLVFSVALGAIVAVAGFVAF